MKKMLFTAAMMAVATSGLGAQTVIYSRVPATLLPSYPSIGFEATSTKELGDFITFGAGPRNLQSATVTMNNWAFFSTYRTDVNWNGNTAFFSLPLTMNLYNVGAGNAVGSLLATRTITANIAWRPEPTPSCGGTAWLAPNGTCYNGLAQNVTFDFSGTVVPDNIIFGISYNTATHGYQPTGISGPYNSLNVAVTTSAASVGADGGPAGSNYRNTSPNFLGNNEFAPNTFSGAFSPMVEFVATTSRVPEPSSALLLVAGAAGLLFLQRRRNA